MHLLFLFLVCQNLPLHAAALTEQAALDLALARPEFFSLQQARLDEAETALTEAKTWPNPSLTFEREGYAASHERSWQISQSLDFSGRRDLRQTAARQRMAATAADNRSRHHARIATLRQTFHALLMQQEQIRAIGTWAEHFSRLENIAGKLASAGEISGYDRRRLAREQQTAAARLAEARAEESYRRSRLEALIGEKINEPLAGPLRPAPPAALATLQDRLTAQPELVSLHAQLAAAETDGAIAQNNLPELTLGFGRKQLQDGPLHDSGNLVMLSLNLPFFDRQQAREQQATAQQQAARAEYSLAQQQAEGELHGLHRQLEQLITAADSYRSTAVQPSIELIRIAEKAYRAGESSLLELLDAYKGALETELTALDLEWKARTVRIALDQLTGKDPQ
ncbi:MAG: TolC family protein [Sterolibacterium sp.]|nr:TolC family protein [Sterolibacterium sp.]